MFNNTHLPQRDVIKFINFCKTLSVLRCNVISKYSYIFSQCNLKKLLCDNILYAPQNHLKLNIFDTSAFLAFLLSKHLQKKSSAVSGPLLISTLLSIFFYPQFFLSGKK